MSEPTDEFDDPWEIANTEDEEWAMLEGECHMGRSGACGLAGSEWCEFECPFRR